MRPEVVIDVARDRRGDGGSTTGEDDVTIHTTSRAFVNGETKRGDLWFVEGRLQHHLLFGQNVEGWFEFGLGETGWDGRVGGPDSPVSLRVGALRERWGKTDLLPVLDVLNPTDARIGPLMPVDQRRLPIPMAVVSATAGAFRSETTLIPFAGTDQLWLRGTDWSLLRQDMAASFLQDAFPEWIPEGSTEPILQTLRTSALTNLRTLDPSLRRGQDAAINGDGLPQATLVNGEVGQRFELAGPGFDVAVMGGFLRSTFPQVELDPEFQEVLREEALPSRVLELQDLQVAFVEGTALNVSWPRTWVVGAEASGLVGEVQVRGEVGYQSHRVVRRHYGAATTVPQLAAAVGVDVVRGTSFQATVEARWQHLFDAPDDLVFARADQLQFATYVRAGLMQERLQLQLVGGVDATFGEVMLRPTVAWRWTDHVQLELGGLFLEGVRTAPPADAATRGREGLLESLTYEGGPGSYWSQNDSVTLAVSMFL